MWSCRLNKMKSIRTKRSITNSASLAEGQKIAPHFFTKIGHWQHLIQLLIASNILAMLLALAEAQSWSNLSLTRVLQHVFFINWVLLAFVALIEQCHQKYQNLSFAQTLCMGFILLQSIVFVTSFVLNAVMYFGQSFHISGLTRTILFDGVLLHLSYGVLIGAFCFRYLYLREQSIRQQHSELNARIQAMQARIHPHFLFNSLNSVISLITTDPDKAEQMLLDLSRLFRASFQELKLVKLKDEIELCQHYLAIEQIRLGDRLQVEWKYQPEILHANVQIPLLTLQPLLENSIFHGVEQFLSPSRIKILVEVLHNQVNIVITNPCINEQINLRQGNGIAIDNVRQRLQAYYGQSVVFQTYSGKGIFTTVVQYRYK